MALTPPGGPLTILQGVNALLRAVHLSEVSDPQDTKDSRQVYSDLDLANTLVQSRGWYWNVENVTLTPDGSGHIDLGSTVYLNVRPQRNTSSWSKRLVRRASRLYDLDAHTDVFSGPECLEVTMSLNFTDLPASLRYYIVCEAGASFVPQNYPTPTNYKFAPSVRDRAKEWAEQEDESMRDGALYETSPHFAKMRQR